MTKQTEAQQVENLVGRLISAGDQDGAKLVRRLLERHAHTQYWYGVRHQRLWQWAHDELTTELREQYFCILANGTADVHEEPTYAQQYNQMEWRMREAEKKLTEIKAANLELLESLVDVSYTLEKARIWGGMEWKYNPLHPVHYLPARDKARAAIAKHGGAA